MRQWLYHVEEPEGKIFHRDEIPSKLAAGWVERISDLGKKAEPLEEPESTVSEPRKPGRPKKVQP